jgi:membrane-bound ClpP family serine protease
VLKDIALFPFVWSAYDKGSAEATRSMIGARGLAMSPLSPTGYIRVQGELWRAEAMGKGPPIGKGRRVVVRGISELKLIVQADDAAND